MEILIFLISKESLHEKSKNKTSFFKGLSSLKASTDIQKTALEIKGIHWIGKVTAFLLEGLLRIAFFHTINYTTVLFIIEYYFFLFGFLKHRHVVLFFFSIIITFMFFKY